MSDTSEKLIFEKEELSIITKSVDKIVVWDKVIKNRLLRELAELGDGIVIGGSLKQLNKFASAHVPDNFKNDIKVIILDATDGDKNYAKAIDALKSVSENLMTALHAEEKLPASVISMIKMFIEGIFAALHYLDEKGTF